MTRAHRSSTPTRPRVRPKPGKVFLAGLFACLGLACALQPKPSPSGVAPTEAPPSDTDTSAPGSSPEASDEPSPGQPGPTPPQTAAADPEAKTDGPQPSEAQRRAGIPHIRFQVELGEAPTAGPDTAPVTIVMFTDFECPFCDEGQSTLAQLGQEYGDRVRFAYKAFPMGRHRNALAAALMAESAKAQGKFWPYFTRLFGAGRLTETKLLTLAEELGLDVKRMAAELDELTRAPAVMRDLRQAKQLAVRSTPTFYINGRAISGALPIDAFRSVVDQELALAADWKRSGVADDQLYQHATQYGYAGVETPQQPGELDRDMIFPVPLVDSPQLGSAEAPLTLVIFGDFECPFCARGAETIAALQARYDEQLRLVYKHLPLPFHPNGLAAARLGVQAQAEGKFWQFYARLNAHGPRITVDSLRILAMDLGLDSQRSEAAITGELHQDIIDRDLDLAVMVGIQGTPAYFINGRPLSGARPEMDFRMIFAEELQRAKALQDAGVPPDQLYQRLAGFP